jgi:hypothetical protein
MVTPVVRFSLRVLCLMVLLLGPSRVARADAWKEIGPDGGNVTAIAVDPVAPSTIYAAAGTGLFKSTDGGTTWAVTGLSGQSIYGLAIDTHTPSTLYAGGYTAGSGVLHKSTDGGASWMPMYSPCLGAQALVSAVIVDPGTPTTVFAVGPYAVCKTTDGGGGWQEIFAGADSAAIAPSAPSTLYLSAGGIEKSTDGGSTWAVVNGSFSPMALSVDPANPAVLYAGGFPAVSYYEHFAGAFKSTDGGATWAAVADLGPPEYVSAFAFDTVNPGTLYAATSSGVAKSTDGGAGWVSTGLTNVNAVILDPLNTATVYAGGLQGMAKSSDAGATWMATNAGITAQVVRAVLVDPSSPSNLYSTGDDNGVFKSTDAGLTWQLSNTGLTDPPSVRALTMDPVTSSTLYVGTSAGLFRSTDGAATWSLVAAAFTSVVSMAIDPVTPTTLYVSKSDSTWKSSYVWKSTDAGATWKAAKKGLPAGDPASHLLIDPAHPSVLYAGTGLGVYKSTNAGRTWRPRSTNLPYSRAVLSLAIDPSNTSTVYASTTLSVYKSTNGGSIWLPSNGGLFREFMEYFSSLVLDQSNPSSLYTAAAESGGVFRSTDAGSSWQPLNVGLGVEPVLSLAMAAGSPWPTLYAGTFGLSVFKRSAGCATDAECDDKNDCTIDVCNVSIGACVHTVGPDDTPCNDGVADPAPPRTPSSCTTNGVCSNGKCVGEAPALPACPQYLTPGRSPRAGGCEQEWYTIPPLGWVFRHLSCVDDDSSCDFGPVADHACTFRLALCFNVNQQNFSCTPSDIATVKIGGPATAKQALNEVLVALGGSADVSGVVFKPPLATQDTCTKFAEITVPLRHGPKGYRGTTQRVQVATSSSSRKSSASSFALVCKPN